MPVRFVHCESPQDVADAVAGGAAEVGISDLPARVVALLALAAERGAAAEPTQPASSGAAHSRRWVSQ